MEEHVDRIAVFRVVAGWNHDGVAELDPAIVRPAPHLNAVIQRMIRWALLQRSVQQVEIN
jgi:hypothetical protein